MANFYVILIRTSDDVYAVVIMSQIASLLPTIRALRSSPVDRLVVFVELGFSSYRFDWDDRPITRFLRNFDFYTNSLTLITAHPTRLTRRVDELEGLYNTFEGLDISWVSLGVDPNAPRRLCNPFLPEYFDSVIANLGDSKCFHALRPFVVLSVPFSDCPSAIGCYQRSPHGSFALRV